MLCVSTTLTGVPPKVPASAGKQLAEWLQSMLQGSQDLIQVLLIHLQDCRTHVHLY